MALESYSYFLAKGLPTDEKAPGRGFSALPKPLLPADYARGAQVYADHCAACDGAQGLGQSSGGKIVFPPLWGPQSFNWGAGMGSVKNAAEFIRANMPLGLGNTLTVQQAWDVATYMDSRVRPQDPRFVGSVEGDTQEVPRYAVLHVWSDGQRRRARRSRGDAAGRYRCRRGTRRDNRPGKDAFHKCAGRDGRRCRSSGYLNCALGRSPTRGPRSPVSRTAETRRRPRCYLNSQSNWLVNYARRYRAGLRVGTSVTDGTANVLVNRRRNKSQPMRWSRRRVDLLLQVRCAVYNGALGSGFGHLFEPVSSPGPQSAA